MTNTTKLYEIQQKPIQNTTNYTKYNQTIKNTTKLYKIDPNYTKYNKTIQNLIKFHKIQLNIQNIRNIYIQTKPQRTKPDRTTIDLPNLQIDIKTIQNTTKL